MHHIYTTPAFVIHSTANGEAGKSLLLFTRDFGMLWATAQGVRLSSSKLRYHLQDYAFVNVSLVRGKEMWRLTGAVEGDRKRTPTPLFVRVLQVLKRMLTGEEKNEKLFEIVEALYNLPFAEEEAEIVECIIMLRLLHSLGYISKSNLLEIFLLNNDFTKEVIGEMRKIKTIAIKEINNALKESHL
ncbi:MAG: recombination protein O N-terminal domain-containing protein [Patescibacteria group bacterium]